METVLVLGAAGLVGSHVAKAFDSERMIATYHSARIEGGIQLDVTDGPAVELLVGRIRPRTIVLAAAEPWVDRCEREPSATRRVNVDAAGHVAAAALRVGAGLVVFSSEYVFDGANGPYAEDDPIAPINEYGRQKAALERIARTVPRHLVCRTTGVYGWERAGKNFVSQLVQHLRGGERFRVPSDQVITPTYAPDLAAALVELVRRGLSGTFNLVGPTTLRRAEFALLAATTFDLPAALVVGRSSTEMDYAAARPLRGGLRDGKLHMVLGRALRTPEDGLVDMKATEGHDCSGATT